MALRFVLVGLVASLGVDLPGDEMTNWVASGRAWVQARIVEAWGPSEEALAEAGAAAFDRVVDRMAADFAADLAAADRPRPGALLAFEPTAVPDTAEPGPADALNRVAQGEGIVAEATTPIALPVRATKLVTALRLTTQAATAWLTLLESTGDPISR